MQHSLGLCGARIHRRERMGSSVLGHRRFHLSQHWTRVLKLSMWPFAGLIRQAQFLSSSPRSFPDNSCDWPCSPTFVLLFAVGTWLEETKNDHSADSSSFRNAVDEVLLANQELKSCCAAGWVLVLGREFFSPFHRFISF